MYILILNPFVSTQYISDSFKKLNIKTIVLYTIDPLEVSSYYKPNKSWFDLQIFLFNADIKTIISKLNDYKIDYVINGYENSANLTDQIAQILTPQLANNPHTSELRADKYQMHKRLAKDNLPHIVQETFDLEIDDIKKFENFRYPCFVKPLNSGGSYGVSKINNYDQLLRFFANSNHQKIKGDLKLYLQGVKSLTYLICEYIEGEEYFVDSFSYKGEHYISSIQKYNKEIINGNPVYRYLEIVKDPNILEKLSSYTKKSLTSLELCNGFAHSEIFIKKNGEPVLIELNPRISGVHGLANILASLEHLPTQVELLANSIFDKKMVYPKKNKVSRGRLLFLFNLSNTPLPDIEENLKKYKSVKLVKQLKDIGSINVDAPSVTNVSAFVICHCDDFTLLSKETEAILLEDKTGFKHV